MDLAKLQSWIGKSETYEERIAPFPANAMAATLDRQDPPYTEGMALPHLWHWLHFLPIHRLSECGYDGHAALGGFLPAVPLPRRMWAGSRLRFLAPVIIGHHLRKTSTIERVEHKQGRSGELVFVTVRHQIHDDEQCCIDEAHDIVYREAADPAAPAARPPGAPDNGHFQRLIKPDPVLLFRYSALTFNGHRIHYDMPFCRDKEGYEGLVVHGPLQAIMLLDLLRRERPDAEVREFRFRMLSTIFDTQAFSLNGRDSDDDGRIKLWSRRADGALSLDAEASLR